MRRDGHSRFSLICLVLWLAIVTAYTTPIGHPTASYKSKHWSPADDPFRDAVQAIAQTSDGFLWIGTQNGLARFNGDGFEFVPVGVSSTSSTRQRINALCADRDEGLWVGTADGLFQLKRGEWIAHPLSSSTGKTVLSLHCSPDGAVYIGTLNGFFCYDEEMYLLVGDARSQQGSGHFPIRTIGAVTMDELWIGVADRLVLLKNREPFAEHQLLEYRSDFLRSVCSTRDGCVWIGSNTGLLRFDPTENKFSHYTRTEGLPDNTVTSVYEDRHGTLWIGTYGGLCRFVNGQFVLETTPEGEPYNQILSFFEDREGNLWIGSKEGLHQLTLQRFTTYTVRDGLRHNNVISIYEDNATNLWIGTWGGGLHQIYDGKLTVYSASTHPMLRNDLILAIHGARDGGIWFSADYDGGLYRLRDGMMQHYGNDHGLKRNAIRALFEHESGNLFIGTASGWVNILAGEQFTNFWGRHGLRTNAIRCILQTRDERVWVGTEAGLSCWTNGGFVTFTKTNGLHDDAIFSLYEDNQQSLWIGTEKGLCQFPMPDFSATNQEADLAPRFISYPFQDNAVLEILEDDFQNLWLATRRGVVRVSKNDLAAFNRDKQFKVPFTIFGKANGMASQVCVGVAKPSAIKSRDGRLWFTTTKGLAVTDPKLSFEKNEIPPPIAIEKLFVNGKQLGTPEVQSNSQLKLPPGSDELEFHYTALSYSAPEKNRFKFKLAGFDSDWVDAFTRRAAFYTRVPPGSYSFHVIGCNNDGVWNTVGATVPFSIRPHFWQTLWFNTLTLLACVSVIAAGTRYVTRRRLQIRFELLEQQHALEKERTRIAQDMHDQLGASLTEIGLLTELTRRSSSHPEEIAPSLGKISARTHEVSQTLDEIIWAVNPKNDSLPSLVAYIAAYAEEIFEMASIHCSLQIQKDLPEIELSAEVRHNIFLALREAVNNIVRHSAASEARLVLQFEKGRFAVTIEDNGKGFDRRTQNSPGNGLENMQNRIESLGGQFSLQSVPGKGTRVHVSVNQDANR